MHSFKTGSLPIWRLRRGMDRRFRAGHPWVYSNELFDSPKGVDPGALVELRDSGGKFLARGFGNPKSLISFRALSRDEQMIRPDSVESVVQTLLHSRQLRILSGFEGFSYRLCFGEVDQLPGLVIDRFAVGDGQVFVIQAHSAGANRLMLQGLEILESYVKKAQEAGTWAKTAVVLRNDPSVRKLEGLTEDVPVVLRSIPHLDLSAAQIRVRAMGSQSILFHVDLLQGQKTGFFLDQFANIQLAAMRFEKLNFTSQIRILDLCCYVGQWGAQLAQFFKQRGFSVSVLAVDTSQVALDRAKKNVEAQGASCELLQANVLKDLGQLPDQSFDLIISDPPAFIPSRKDIPQGSHAYLQLNTQVFRILKPGGGVVCCSCSALLDEDAFTQILAKSARRNAAVVQWIGRGAASPDHPMMMEFPEGRYLKSWMGIHSIF